MVKNMFANPHQKHDFHKHQQQNINVFFGQNFAKS
jgi:hypothetical protein